MPQLLPGNPLKDRAPVQAIAEGQVRQVRAVEYPKELLKQVVQDQFQGIVAPESAARAKIVSTVSLRDSVSFNTVTTKDTFTGLLSSATPALVPSLSSIEAHPGACLPQERRVFLSGVYYIGTLCGQSYTHYGTTHNAGAPQ
jgi:hypothetical protein